MKQKPTLNIAERAIAAISPKWGFKRLQYKSATALIGGYNGASKSRAALRNWNPSISDANDDLNYDLPTLRGRSRDLVRNAPLAGGAVNTIVANVVGTGLAMQSTIDAKYLGMSDDEADQWQSKTEREFLLWAESVFCDATRVQNFYGLQSLALRSALESGDIFALTPMLDDSLIPYRLAIQLIEADRVSNPKGRADTDTLIGGIEINDRGRPVACHICNRHPSSMRSAKSAQWTRVTFAGNQTGRRNVIHLFDRRRPGQVRGIPVLAPVIEPLKQLGRYTDAELQAAVVSGAFSVFIKMDPEAFDTMFQDDSKSQYLQSSLSWDGSINNNTLDGPGKAVNLLPGESVESANPGRPNSEFDPFVQAIIRQIGVQLELPFEVMIKHFTSSYSAARAALLDAWRFFRGRREWLATYFCQPIYELFLDHAISNGRISAPGYFSDPMTRKAYSNAIWIGDGPGSIDPEKEINAAKERIDVGVSTLSAESLLYDGVDWRTKHIQRVKEKKARDEGGLTDKADNTSAIDMPKREMVEVNISQDPVKVDINQEPLQIELTQADIHLHQTLIPQQPKNVKRIPVRDPQTGLITEIHEVEEDEN